MPKERKTAVVRGAVLREGRRGEEGACGGEASEGSVGKAPRRSTLLAWTRLTVIVCCGGIG